MYGCWMNNSSSQRQFAADASCTMPHNSYNVCAAAALASALVFALINIAIILVCGLLLAIVLIGRLCIGKGSSVSA